MTFESTSPSFATFSSFDSSLQLALTIARGAEDRKGAEILLLEVGEVSYLTEYFVIVTGFSKTQVRAIAQNIQAVTAERHQRSPQHTEGVSDCSWVVLDYGDVIAHVLLEKERQFYNLEAFWGHAQAIEFIPEEATQS